MEALKLTENEQQRFEELFQMCDLGKTAKIPKLVVGELLASSGLPTDVSLQIADMCGASRLGYFGRSQFYIALKLIAVAQQQLPLAFESFANNLPLPAFNHAALNLKLSSYDPATYSTLLPEPQPPQPIPTAIHMMPGGVLLPPPTKKHVRNMSGTVTQAPVPPLQSHPSQLNNPHVLHPASQHPPQSMINTPISQSQVNTSQSNQQSNHSSSTAAGSDVGWASFPSPTKPNAPVTGSNNSIDIPNPQSPPIDQRSTSPNKVPSTPSDSGAPSATLEWNQFGGSKRSFNFDSCSLSSADYATSEAESTDDVWSINEEQREYYVNQFLSMQPDLKSTVKGVVAKEFFEKSKLPTKELSKIWKLSDVNRDGALTLQEFCTAMHLVVLRRNDVELPSSLPASLIPYMPASSEPFAADLGDELPDRSPSPLLQHQTSWRGSNTDTATTSGKWSATESASNWQQEVHQGGANNDTQQWNSEHGDQWQQTGNSDTSSQQQHWRTSESGSPPLQAQWTGSSHSRSPTSKPVNFDSFPATICDPEIAHPVAMKMSPSNQNNLIDVNVRPRTDSEPVPYDSAVAGLRHRSNTESLLSDPTHHQPLPVRPRPTPKKAQSMGPAAMENLLHYPPHQTVQGYQSLPGGPPTAPPTVPPRNQSAGPFSAQTGDIGRSHSDDPFFPQGDIGGENFADFSTKFGEPTNEPFGAPESDAGDIPTNHPTADMRRVMLPTVTAPKPHTAHQFSIRDKREIQNSIRSQRERNLILARINSELNSELQEVMEQRISLEIQLEHLKPC